MANTGKRKHETQTHINKAHMQTCHTVYETHYTTNYENQCSVSYTTECSTVANSVFLNLYLRDFIFKN